jgi:4'-phosphopantetheinyl transferase
MLSHVSQQLGQYFASGSIDYAPENINVLARLVYMPVTSDPDVSRLCGLTLSAGEVQRSGRFSTAADRAHFNQRRAFRRYCGATAIASNQPLEEIDFSATKNGRPFLPGYPDISFGFSSCQDGFLGAWSATHAIGVDIESKARQMDFIALARQFFSETEVAVVEGMQGLKRIRAFYQLWTLKEAALKCIGEGLPFGLDTFEFELTPALQIVKAPFEHGGPDSFFANIIEESDRCAAVVIRHQNGIARDLPWK